MPLRSSTGRLNRSSGVLFVRIWTKVLCLERLIRSQCCTVERGQFACCFMLWNQGKKVQGLGHVKIGGQCWFCNKKHGGGNPLPFFLPQATAQQRQARWYDGVPPIPARRHLLVKYEKPLLWSHFHLPKNQIFPSWAASERRFQHRRNHRRRSCSKRYWSTKSTK